MARAVEPASLRLPLSLVLPFGALGILRALALGVVRALALALAVLALGGLPGLAVFPGLAVLAGLAVLSGLAVRLALLAGFAFLAVLALALRAPHGGRLVVEVLVLAFAFALLAAALPHRRRL